MTGTPSSQDVRNMGQMISELKTNADSSEIKQPKKFETQMRTLEDKFEVIAGRMNKLIKNGEPISEEAWRGLTNAWQELKDSYRRARQYLH